jgi:hypothetical protein
VIHLMVRVLVAVDKLIGGFLELLPVAIANHELIFVVICVVRQIQLLVLL